MKRKLIVETNQSKWANIKLLALDFDGTLTDGFVYTDQYGNESVRCSRRDSLGINALKQLGVDVIVISTETNPVVAVRCKKLGIKCFSGVPGNKKIDVLKKYMKENGILRPQVAYMGDDLNDIGCLKFAGVAVTVADGHERCKYHVDYVTKKTGGNHAVREVCDLIIFKKHP